MTKDTLSIAGKMPKVLTNFIRQNFIRQKTFKIESMSKKPQNKTR